MKGVILAGGQGTRLRPLTLVTSKQLLPVYDRPMIFYPLQTLLDAGIKEIFIISSPEHAGQYLSLLGSGKKFGAKFTYEIQDEPAGLAHGLSLAESFADEDDCCMLLGDNIFEDNVVESIKKFDGGAQIFVKEVSDPHRFGVVEIDNKGKVLSVEEKPENPKSNLAQTGLYIYDKNVFKYIKQLKPSARGELEITDLNDIYLKKGQLKADVLKGKWIDAGTFDSLLEAANFIASKNKK